jgi:hypothetical protein
MQPAHGQGSSAQFDPDRESLYPETALEHQVGDTAEYQIADALSEAALATDTESDPSQSPLTGNTETERCQGGITRR